MKKFVLPLLIIVIAAILRLWMLNAPDVHEDEMHYIQDSYRLFNKDPYMSVRYHARKHPMPSSGHPFLYQIEQTWIFKLFGVSVYTARLPNALSGIAIVLVVFFFTKRLGSKVALLAAFFMAISPMAVRFSRNAHLDTLFALWITICALSIWRYLGEGKKYWLLFAGLTAGFTISTKLNGVYIIPMVILLLAFVKKENISKKLIWRVLADSLWVFVPAASIAFLLSDPSAYIDGIQNPSDPTLRFFSKEYITNRALYLLSPFSMLKFFEINLLLLTPGIFLTAAISWFYLIFQDKTEVKRFLILWTLPFLNIFIIHGIDETSAYGWVLFLPPIMLGAAYFINKLERKLFAVSVVFIVLTCLPFLIFYGIYIRRMPYKDFPVTHNRQLNETFYQDVIAKVNHVTPRNARVFILPQTIYPLFSIRDDISWSYNQKEKADVYVVSSPELVNDLKKDLKLITVMSASQDGQLLTRYIFKAQ